jgi:DNA helicase-2/ATP-dependent DNA helicase PcrA
VWTGTVHQAKGLQWPVVFVVRMSDDQFPLFGDQQEMQQEAAGGSGGGGSSGHKRNPHEDEERRLAYVAMSRAESFLFLTYPVKVRTQFGNDKLRA